jgi:hypothetical protein
MSTPDSSRSTFLRTWAYWAAGAFVFPFAGLLGTAVAGRVDSPGAALTGGLAAGLAIGAGQSFVSRRRLNPLTWTAATAVGLAVGLLLGASVVDYQTSLGDLALMGALTGVVLGLAQALAMPTRTHRRWTWAAAMPLLWALGWTVTTLAGVDVEKQYTHFGITGALTFSALSGLLLHVLLPYRQTTSPLAEGETIETPA